MVDKRKEDVYFVNREYPKKDYKLKKKKRMAKWIKDLLEKKNV